MAVTSASEIAVVGKPGITVAPAGAPASGAGVRTWARKAAALSAVTGVHTCLLAGPVTHVEPPALYVKRFGTSGLPAEPNALWHPLQTSAKDAGKTGPVPPVGMHVGTLVMRFPGVPEVAGEPPSSPGATLPVVPPTPDEPTDPEPTAPVVPEVGVMPPEPLEPVPLLVPWPPDVFPTPPDVVSLPGLGGGAPVPALPQPAPKKAAARMAGARRALREV
jgi:hypothetical protein